MGQHGCQCLQLGDNNTSFISQGLGLVCWRQSRFTGGSSRDRRSPGWSDRTAYGIGLAPSSSFRNAAASIQRGDNNVNAIIQDGNGNEAVNIQQLSLLRAGRFTS